MDVHGESRPAIHRLEVIAHQHHGVFSRADAMEVGVSEAMLRRLRSRGLVHRLHPASYSLGCRPLSSHAAWLAAVVGAGPGSALSGIAAAKLWHIWRGRVRGAPEVLVSRRHRRMTGVRVRETRSLPADEIAIRDGIAVLIVERLLLELAAGGMPARMLCDLIDEAAFQGNFNEDRMRRTLARAPRRRGRRRLIEAFDRYLHGEGGSKSTGESRVARRVAAVVALPFECNRRRTFGGRRMRPDVYVPALKLAIEYDGTAAHGRPTRRRQDAERDEAYARADVEVVRIRESREPEDLATMCAILVERQAALALQSSHLSVDS